MSKKEYLEKTKQYLSRLVDVKPNRRTGSPGNMEAVEFFRGTINSWGYDLDTTLFSCLDHVVENVSLTIGAKAFEVHASPYSLGCDMEVNLVVVSTLDELEKVQCEGKILLLKDKISEEQLMPKNFVFYNPDEHKHIYCLLESKKPAAIITATKKSPMTVGAIYPFPMIQDGDFDIPSIYCTDVTGEIIAKHTGEKFRLIIKAERIETSSFNVIASKNRSADKKIIICAHIDAYGFSPGALDNASGTAVLLILGEMLEEYNGSLGVEIIAFNGEDHYSVAGQMDYLKRYSEELGKILVAVNIDDIGYVNGNTHFSSYSLPIEIQGVLSKVVKRHEGIERGDPWYQGDHMIFVQNNVPSIAVTSENMVELMTQVTHTERDTVELVDMEKIVTLATALKQFIESFN